MDCLGTHQHLAVDIDLTVAPNGGLRLRSGAQRFYEGPVGFSFSMLVSGVAEVCEWYDETDRCFRIEVDVAIAPGDGSSVIRDTSKSSGGL